MKIMVIQGPNINMLGKRDRRIYGSMTMSDIHEQMKAVADQAGVGIEFFQSNFEGEIVDKIQECLGEFDGIIINPAIEVHISNIYQREEFRHKSLVAPVSTGHIAGFGPIGYHLAIIGMLQIFEQLKRIESASQNA